METIGRYEIESYSVILPPDSRIENRQRILYHSYNGVDYFVERFYGSIRSGYQGSNSLFNGIEYIDIKTHIIGQSIVVNDKSVPPNPLIYISLDTIESLQQSGNTITILDSNSEPLTLEFLTENDCNQAHSIIDYLLQNPTATVDSMLLDNLPPVIFFNSYFIKPELRNTPDTESYISLDGDISGVPYNTGDGDLFITSANLSDFDGGVITRQNIIDYSIYAIDDNRDGSLTILPTDLVIRDISDFELTQISSTGQYSVEFSLYDSGQNKLQDILVINVN
jgi:hypothetical protein